MKNRKELMNRFIEEKGEKIFDLFYDIMKGQVDVNNLSDEEKVIAKCIKNQCTDKNGGCYDFYSSLKKIKSSRSKEKIVYLYEIVLRRLCKEMFFNSLKLGYVLKNRLQ